MVAVVWHIMVSQHDLCSLPAFGLDVVSQDARLLLSTFAIGQVRGTQRLDAMLCGIAQLATRLQRIPLPAMSYISLMP